MRLCPFVSNESIEDIEEEWSHHDSDLDATDDQLVFNDNVPD